MNALLASNRQRHPAAHGAHTQAPFSHVAPLLTAALILGASGGFVLAAVLTLSRALSFPLGSWWEAVVQAHGHLQLYGWAGLFVLGVAFHFLPRLRGAALAFPQLIPWIVGAQTTSLVLRALSEPLATTTGAAAPRAGLVASGLLECFAFGSALLVLVATARQKPALRSRSALWSVLPFFACAFVALGLASVVNLVNTLMAATAPDSLVPSAGDAVNVTLGLFGFLVPMALGMSARALPMYSGLDAFPKRFLWPAAIVYALGLACATVGAAAEGIPLIQASASVVSGLGLAIMGAILVLFVAIFMRTMRGRGHLPARVAQLAPAPEAAARSYATHVASEHGAYGPFVALVASAYLWAVIGGGVLLVDGVFQVIGAGYPITFDAARHALALGFIALLICGIAPRMLPGFSGGRIASPKYVHATLWLGNAAAVFRVGSLLLAPALASLDGAGGIGTTLDTLAFGLSGPLGLALAICLLINLWPAIWPSLPAGNPPVAKAANGDE